MKFRERTAEIQSLLDAHAAGLASKIGEDRRRENKNAKKRKTGLTFGKGFGILTKLSAHEPGQSRTFCKKKFAEKC